MLLCYEGRPGIQTSIGELGFGKSCLRLRKEGIRPDQPGCIQRKSRNADIEEKSVSSEKTGRRSGLKLYSFNDGYLLSLKRCHRPSATLALCAKAGSLARE